MSAPKKLIFLSYAHADLDAVTRIYQELVAAGFTPWMDKFSLKPGQDWREEIERAIRHSGAFLSMISSSSVDRGGILRGEMKLALDLRGERLDDRGILIPVRLEHCTLPKELHNIQTLDWFLPDGPAKLMEALSSLRPQPNVWKRTGAFLAIGALGVAAAVGFYAFKPSDSLPRIDLTVWRVVEDNATGAGACGAFRFLRQPLNQPLNTGDRIRLDIQTSRKGFVYVISREIDDANTAAALPKLLFPVRMLNDGRNRITPGHAIMIPPAGSDVCQTLQLTHAGAAEEITVLFSEKELTDFPLHDQPWAVDLSTFSKLKRSANSSPVSTNSGSTRDARATELPDSESRDLNFTSAGPDAGFAFPAKTAGPLVATFTLRTQK